MIQAGKCYMYGKKMVYVMSENGVSATTRIVKRDGTLGTIATIPLIDLLPK